MKKIVVILTAFVLTLFVVACGDSGSGNSAEENKNSKTETDTGDTNADTNADTAADTGTEADTGDTGDTDTNTDTGNTPDTDTDTDTGAGDENDPCSYNPCAKNETCSADATEAAGYVCICNNEGELRVGETVCPDNPKGLLYQKCENGSWADTEKCILCDYGEYPKVCGTYAQKMWFTSVSKLYSIDGAEGWTRTYFLIEQEQEQEKVHIKATYCNIKIDNDKSSLLAIVMPQSFADALGTANKEAVISKRDNGTFDFAQDVFWEIRGINPVCYGDNPAEYTLPEDENAVSDDNVPCVQNWDNDALPGLTVIAKGTLGGNASLGMIEKSSSMIHDGLISPDGLQINALVDWTDEQKILVVEGTNQLLKSGAQNLQQNSSKQPGFTGPFNFIEQFKIPEGSDCAYIVDNAAAIFSSDPVTLN